MGAAFAQIGLNAVAGKMQHNADYTMPDLTGNVDKANTISNTATDQATQTFNTAKAYNQNAQDTLGRVTGTQLPVMDRIAGATNQNLGTYGSTFAPLQQKQAQDALDYGSEGNVRRLQGMAMADQASNAEAARRNAQLALESEGVDPASIRGGALDAQARLKTAADVAGAGTQSALNTENTARGMVQQANQLGLQVGGLGTQQAGVGANIGQGVIGGTNQTNATGVQNLTANNGLLNTGITANESGVNIADEAYKQRVAAAATDANNIRGVMSLADGGAVGSRSPIPAYFDVGGPVPGSTDGAIHGVYERGGPVTHTGALPVPPDPTHPTDTKVGLLTPDEYVMPKDVAIWKGHEFFHKMVDKARMEMHERRGIPHGPAVGA